MQTMCPHMQREAPAPYERAVSGAHRAGLLHFVVVVDATLPYEARSARAFRADEWSPRPLCKPGHPASWALTRDVPARPHAPLRVPSRPQQREHVVSQELVVVAERIGKGYINNDMLEAEAGTCPRPRKDDQPLPRPRPHPYPTQSAGHTPGVPAAPVRLRRSSCPSFQPVSRSQRPRRTRPLARRRRRPRPRLGAVQKRYRHAGGR